MYFTTWLPYIRNIELKMCLKRFSLLHHTFETYIIHLEGIPQHWLMRTYHTAQKMKFHIKGYLR